MPLTEKLVNLPDDLPPLGIGGLDLEGRVSRVLPSHHQIDQLPDQSIVPTEQAPLGIDGEQDLPVGPRHPFLNRPLQLPDLTEHPVWGMAGGQQAKLRDLKLVDDLPGGFDLNRVVSTGTAARWCTP